MIENNQEGHSLTGWLVKLCWEQLVLGCDLKDEEGSAMQRAPGREAYSEVSKYQSSMRKGLGCFQN